MATRKMMDGRAKEPAAGGKKLLRPKRKRPRPQVSVRSLKKENAALRDTLSGVWGLLVDVDDSTSHEAVLDAVDDACELMVADWPEDFQMDEPSPASSELPDRETIFKELAERAAATEDTNEKAQIFRQALALELGVDEQQITQQVDQMTAQEYVELASGYFWLLTYLTAKLPMAYRKEVDRFITVLKAMKKLLPRKHGPTCDPIITEAMRLRDKEGMPYTDIHSFLLGKYREQMISKGITPDVLGKRVRSRRSRVKKSGDSVRPSDPPDRHG